MPDPSKIRGGERREANLPPELAEALVEVEAFAAEIQAYRQDVRRLLEHQRARKRREIRRRYEPILKQLRNEERQRRLDAIARFEKFLEKYPNNPSYTPDALFRLAELHFEKANDEFITASEEFDALIIQYDQGKLDTEPAEPRQDYRRTVALFDQLISRFPDYRNLDGAFYLKGYCLAEMGEEKPALDEFQALVSKFPASRFAAETWLRIGEYYFDHNNLAEAIAAYVKVVEFRDSPYYDKGLYKLAWTYYRDDKYVEAIARFRELIEFSDEMARKTGEAGSVLRAEAIQYLAVSLQEEDWDGDGNPDAGAGFQRVLRFVKGDKDYDVEILRALAEIFFDNAKYEEAIATIRHLLRNFPKHKENPELHAQMVTALERVQRNDEAFAERANLARAYGEGSDWFGANAHDPEALTKAEELMEDALIQAATYHHSRAQQLKEQAQGGDAAAEEEAIREYRLAAVAYDNYLRRYPKSQNAYQLGFYYAECLYYSFRFAEAATQYAAVRDSKLGTQYRERAGFSTILAIENDIRRLITEGRMAPRGILIGEAPAIVPRAAGESDDDYAVVEIEKQVIPQRVEELLAERIMYVELRLKSNEDTKRLPRIAYKVGEAYYDYKHFDEARKWFRKVLKEYPGVPPEVGKAAFEYGMDTFSQANDYVGMGAWAQEMEGVAQVDAATKDRITTIKLGAEFRLAKRLFEQKKYEKAAEAYMKLIDENPGNKYADAALNNAAYAFEQTRRFESATNTYERIYREYPKSQYAEHALFQVAVNSFRFYDYDRAVSSYLLLVQSYPDSENRSEALYRAGLLQEQNQDYRAAATNFERYAKLFPDKADTPEVFFRAGNNFAKLEDTRNEIRVYETFARRYGQDPKENGRVIKGLARIADIYFEKNRKREARRAWQRVIDEFNRRGLQAGAFEAKYPAEAQFRLVEVDFTSYEQMKLSGSLKNQGRVIKEMQKRIKDLSRRYAEVIPYKNFEWTLAALYRLGHLYQLFATALYEAPIPGGFGPDEEDMYRTQLEDIALPIEDLAVQRYEQAYEKAREFRVSNDWTKKILIALNKYKPSDYPLFKEERRMRVPVQRTPARLISLPPPPEPEEPEPAEDLEGDEGDEGEDEPAAEEEAGVEDAPGEEAPADDDGADEGAEK